MVCRICANAENNRTFRIREMMFGFREEFNYSECSACGCLQIAEIPQDMSKYYPSDYHPWRHQTTGHQIERFAAIQRDKYAVFQTGLLGRLLYWRYPNSFLQVLGQAKPDRNSSILDVGCGSGRFLYSLWELGFRNLVGIDPYIQADFAAPSVKILKKTIVELPDSERFHFIFSNHSLEHMWDQEGALSKARNLLNPGGVCVVRMPVKTETIWNLYGTDWMQIDAPRHFCVHTLGSFKHLCQKVGFAITDILFDSDERQFWVSEQYRRDIPLEAADSYYVNPRKSVFTDEQIEKFRIRAKELNRIEQGDQAAFFMKAK